MIKLIHIKNINYYIFTIFLFSVFYLYEKHTGGSDSTISEWLINYEGGFTKRGLIGQLAIILSEVFNIGLRDSILIFQIIITGIYLFLLLFFLSKIKLDKLTFLAIFSPIFILYPVAEIEVLARKEVFIFCFFLLYLFLKDKIYKIIYKLSILPLAVLIWEPVIFFFSFWFVIDLIEDNHKKFLKNIFQSSFYYLPSIFIAAYIAFNPISESDHIQMVEFLENNFDEKCYMSCGLLLSKSSIYDQFYSNFQLYSLEIFLRYTLVILIGFAPLILIINFSELIKFKKKVIILFIIIPIIVLFAMMADWGRIVNIFYTFSILTFLYLRKKNLIKMNNLVEKNYFVKILNNKKIFLIFFIIFAFGWNPKTTLVEDVASKPGYQIPRKAIKIIYYKYINN